MEQEFQYNQEQTTEKPCFKTPKERKKEKKRQREREGRTGHRLGSCRTEISLVARANLM